MIRKETRCSGRLNIVWLQGGDPLEELPVVSLINDSDESVILLLQDRH